MILPGGLFARAAEEMLLLEPRCSAAGFQRATGMQEGQEAWGNPKVLCPSAGLKLCSGGVLVAGMAVLLLAALEVPASFKISLETWAQTGAATIPPWRETGHGAPDFRGDTPITPTEELP